MKLRYLLFAAIGLLLATSCTHFKSNKDANGIDLPDTDIPDSMVVHYADSSKYASVEISGVLPNAKDSITKIIRDTLLTLLAKDMANVSYGDDEPTTPLYTGDWSYMQAFIDYYGSTIFKKLDMHSAEDAREREADIKSDSSSTEAEKKEFLASIPSWSYEMNITTLAKTERYYIVDCSGYCYYGGAHGGVIGLGAITFDRATGQRIRNWFKPDAQHALQKLIRKGLIGYLNSDNQMDVNDKNLNDYLSIDGPEIPLPQAMSPYPSKEGLTFIYAQYEIAAYAAGMPAFILKYSDLKPYLTDQAIKLLGI